MARDCKKCKALVWNAEELIVKLGKLVAEGKFVNEGHWNKMQEGKK